MSLHHPAGSLASADAVVRLTPEAARWAYCGLSVFCLHEAEARSLVFPGDEALIVPLRGRFRVQVGGGVYSLRGRPSPFAATTDRLYLPPGVAYELSAPEGGEVAVATARAEQGGEPLLLAAEDTSVELRGAGRASRQINGLLAEDLPGPQRLMVVEVLTPAGNWSSYPPHKHDEWAEGEVPLEEIYYYRIDAQVGFGIHRTYTTDGSLDETVVVGDGDVFLVPRGYHGPCAAAPGYDMYYLNVMAGPQRRWLITTDPKHHWLWQAWETEKVDPRLPFYR